MPIEAAVYLTQLVATNPPGTDKLATADDQLRLIKSVLLNTFPQASGVINATPAQLNALTGLSNSKVVVSSSAGLLTTSSVDASALSKIGTALTASRALISDSSGNVAVSTVTSTEVSYLSGVTSALQTQLDGKSATSHDHTTGSTIPTGGITNLAVTAAKIANATITTAKLDNTVTTGSQAITTSSPWLVPAGRYMMSPDNSAAGNFKISILIGATWHAAPSDYWAGGYVLSDGTNVRVACYNINSTIQYLKFA